MDGLEAIEINIGICKNIIDFRIDASTYKKDYVRTDKILKGMNTSTIEKEMKSIQNFGAYSLCNDIIFVEEGVPFLMTQNVRYNYINWNNVRCVDGASHKMLYKSHCKKNQVLVTMAGEYLGRVAVYDKDFICSSNQAIAKITLKDGVPPYYVSTFLNSRYGQNQINRFKTITGQPNINMALIKSLMIPIMSDKICDTITEIVVAANEKFDKSRRLIEKAEIFLSEDIGINTDVESKEKFSIRTFSCSVNLSGRFDAEYYQDKYDDYNRILKGYSNGYGLIKDICIIKDKNYIPEEKTEYSYIELANVGQEGDISDCDKLLGLELPTRARRIVATDDVIISSVEGSLSKCALVAEEYNGFICTNGFYVLKSSVINPETLLMLFKSKFIQALMKKGCSGTILSAIGKEELEEIPLPIINDNTQEKVKKMVSDSHLARKQGEKLLKKAIILMETAIEQGEEKTLSMYK